MKYEISPELLQSIVNILQELPYKTTFSVMDAIRVLKPIEGPEAKPD